MAAITPISVPAIRRYGRGDQLHVTAQRVWTILVALAQAARLPDVTVKRQPRNAPTITYGELADLVGRGFRAGRTLSRELMIIGEYCRQNGLPCLNAMVTYKDGDCGDGVVLSAADARSERRAIAAVDWFEYGVPSAGTLRKQYSLARRR